MKRTKRQKVAMTVALILAALLILPMLISAIGALIPSADASGTVTQKDIDKRKADAKVYQDQKADIKKEIAQLKKDKAAWIKLKGKLDEQIDLLEREIENNDELIKEITVQLAAKQEELSAAIAREAEAKELFAIRMRTMEEVGDTSYLSILFQSSSFSDLLAKMDIVSEFMEADRRVIRELAELKSMIEEAKLALEEEKAEQFNIKKELIASQEELAEQYAELDLLIAELSNDMAAAEQAYADAEEAEKAEQKKIAELQAALKKQQEAANKSTQYVGGEYTWPLPGYNTISSPFGNRIHPILKYPKMHTGIDIPAPNGIKILAANDGTVIVATYSSGYGNYVCVDHGGGKATLYAHMSKIAVKSGTKVKKGEVVGYVGSTGLSTGNHLHFECIENGKQVNPMNYFTKK